MQSLQSAFLQSPMHLMVKNQLPRLPFKQCDWGTETDAVNCYEYALNRDGQLPVNNGKQGLRIAHRLGYRPMGRQVDNTTGVTLGVDKLAVYATKDGEITHFARQQLNGQWQSKLGDGPIATHTLDQLEGSMYGKVKRLYSRNWLSHKPQFGLKLLQQLVKTFIAD